MNVFRAALTSDFWMTGIAIVRYIPRAFRVKQVDGNLFFTEEKRQEYRRRVESVTPDSQRQWGTSNHLTMREEEYGVSRNQSNRYSSGSRRD
jgi:hypothetical protein